MDPLDPLRWKLLTVLHAAIGGCAIVAGGALAVWPNGQMLGLTPALLEGSSFRSFVIPGLVLYGAVGVQNAIAAYLVLRREPGAELVSFTSASVLLVFLAISRLMLREPHWVQPAFACLAALIVIQAVILRRHAAHAPTVAPAGAHAP